MKGNTQFISLLESAGLDSDKATELSSIITEAMRGKETFEKDVKAITETALLEARAELKSAVAEGLSIIPRTVVEGLSGQLLTEAKEAIQEHVKSSFVIQADMINAANRQLLEAGRIIKEMEDDCEETEDELEETKKKLKEKEDDCEELEESLKTASTFIDAILSCDSVSKLDKIAELREAGEFSYSKGYAILESNNVQVATKANSAAAPFANEPAKKTESNGRVHPDVAKYLNI